MGARGARRGGRQRQHTQTGTQDKKSLKFEKLEIRGIGVLITAAVPRLGIGFPCVAVDMTVTIPHPFVSRREPKFVWLSFCGPICT